MIEQWDVEDEQRRIGIRRRPVSEYFTVEQPLRQRLFSLRMDRFSQISVRTNRYSVPVRLIGRTVRAMLHASELVVYDGQQEVARHERLVAKGRTCRELDHYLEAMVRKPGAFPGATALEQARSAGKFTPVHDAWWEAAHGEREGTRALIEVLLLGRHVSHELLVTGLASALRGRRRRGSARLCRAGGDQRELADRTAAGYTLATTLVNELVEAADEKILTKTTARYGRVDLLCTDELGYMDLDRKGGGTAIPGPDRAGGEEQRRHRLQRVVRRVDENVHRSAALRGHRRPAHLRRGHH